MTLEWLFMLFGKIVEFHNTYVSLVFLKIFSSNLNMMFTIRESVNQGQITINVFITQLPVYPFFYWIFTPSPDKLKWWLCMFSFCINFLCLFEPFLNSFIFMF